ncbi:sugar (glycoside-pentoside-hexuronide) transporter [Novosphingobium sp. Rr 2-17]|uniref:MFS transporter n=1 Tax=Novosphingobium sp. Rr 2-17 TaxID=555793 RepID=UPI000269890B|nr:MFS transporter [Novosphingobium sp. Rr 2-17]EIZ77591.1 sugar (glycoside-pentoside-hexuronide) transporter [Novosphingobium sp. Rr 2-17]
MPDRIGARAATAVAASPNLLTEARLFAYASGNFGKGLIFAGADVTILFLLTDLLDLSALVAGTLMMVALVGDLVFDLLAAALVIRLRRSGKGYRWLVIAGAVPCGIAFAVLYAMPLVGVREGWMLALALLAFRGAYAVVDVPHNALMAQMTCDSRARGRVSGYRLLFSTLSSLAIAMVLAPLVQEAGRDGSFDTVAVTGAVAGMLFTLTMVLCAMASRGGGAPPRDIAASRDGILVPLSNRLVLGIGLLAVLTGFAVPTFGRMMLYIGTYVVDRPDIAGTLLLTLTFGQFAGVLVWTVLTTRIDKSRLLVIGHGVSALGIALFGLFLGEPKMLPVCAALIGFGFANVFMLPWGLLADAIDFVAWRHGRRFETGLFAFYLVAVKASGAAATALIGWSLGWLGYVPGTDQTTLVEGGMLGLGLGIPLAGCLSAMLLLRHFRIGHARHALVLAGLTRRSTRRARQLGAEPVSGLKLGLEKSSGDGVTLAGGSALSVQARQSMSRSIVAPAAVGS